METYPSKKHFTLIEMLVVIAIVGILAAMLMPGLQKSIQAARSITCSNNLKQTSVWAVSYADDWMGILPHNGKDGYDRGYEYLSLNTWYQKYPGFSNSKKSGTILHCPAVSSITPLHTNDRGYTYGLNHYLGGRKLWANGLKPPAYPRINNLTTKKYWFGDSKYKDYGGYLPDRRLLATSINKNERSWPWPWMVDYQNLGWSTHPNCNSNFVLGDGHCEGVTMETVSYVMTSAEVKDWEYNSN